MEDYKKRKIKDIKLEILIRKIGVRIDIWTHLMRGCIINYVH